YLRFSHAGLTCVLASPDLFLFSLLRLLPSSTLFPYTTLFRSQDGPAPRLNFVSIRVRDPAEVDDAGRGRVERLDALDVRLELPQDRKSTRLNSSHVKISYAVFCLKKKKKKEQLAKLVRMEDQT